jgi:hypothetical protein
VRQPRAPSQLMRKTLGGSHTVKVTRGRMTFVPDCEPVLLNPSAPFFWLFRDLARRLGDGGWSSSATVYAIGWIGSAVQSRGDTPEECIHRLLDAYEAGHRFSDGTMGLHICDVCRPPVILGERVPHAFAWKGRQAWLRGHGYHLVHNGGALFVCPAMILHYIVDHQYQPPAPFVDAVVKGRILTEGDLAFHS